MKKVFKYRNKLHLEQGISYFFVFFKKILFPDQAEYFVAIDPFGDKHLIPTKYYSSYNLIVGTSYLCKIDKINCLGRIFIEPPHPYYRENNSYLFEYFEEIEKIHKSGNLYKYYQFRGEHTNNAFLNKKYSKLPQKLKSGLHYFRIQKITKGRVYIDY